MSGVQFSADFKHGPVSGPVNGLMGAIVIATFGRAWNKVWAWDDWSGWRDTFPPFPSYVPLIIAALGTVAAVLVGLRRDTDTKNIIFRAACWSAAGIWATVTIQFGWSWLGVAFLGGGTIVAALLVPGFASYQPPVFQFQPGAGVDFETELLEYIINFCRLKPHERPALKKIADWPKEAGHSYMITAVRGSTLTWKKIREIQDDLAAALQLEDGCPVEAESAGTHKGATMLHISTKNYMAEPIDYPHDYSPLTIENEFSVGRFLDATPTLIELKQAAGLAAGQRGGGKTVLLQNITASLVRCIDVVVWHIDLNGGGMSAPWTTPYAKKLVDHPAVDWVATTPRDALRMANVALRIARDRKKSYQALLIEKGVDVLPVRPDLPLIMIIVDESAEVTGETAVKEAQAVSKALQEVQRIGRAMCVNVFFSTQRATADYLPAQLKKGSSVAFCTRVKDESELAYVFDWHKGINPDDLIHPGQMYIQRGTGAVKMFKGYRLMPNQIQEIVHATQPIRAGAKLDRRALYMGGKTYAGRWHTEDCQSYLAGLRGELTDMDDDFDMDDDDFDNPPPPPPIGVPGPAAPTGGAPRRERPDAHDDDPVADDGLTTFHSAIAALRQDTLRAVEEAKRAAAGQQPGQQPDRPAAPGPAAPASPAPTGPPTVESIPIGDQQRFLHALENLPTVPDPGHTPPGAGADPEPEPEEGPGPRHAFIVQYIESAGPAGRKTGDVIKAVLAAGFDVRREQTVKEDLALLRDKQMLLTQMRAGQPVYGTWFDQDYGA
jgi:hypothetical protein